MDVTVAAPGAMPVTIPVVSTDAMELSLGTTVQVAIVVRSWVVESLNVPVAVNGSVEWTAMLIGAVEEDAGVIAIAVRVAALTVNVVEPVTEPSVAPIVVVPAATPVAMPGGPDVVMVAAAALELVQCTSSVMSCVVPSLKEPLADIVNSVSGAMVGVEGKITMLLMVAPVTFSVALPAIDVAGSVAVIVALPMATPLARPAVLTDAILAGVADQSTDLVTLRNPPSL